MTDIVLIPTFNERESLPILVKRLATLTPDVHVLVIDDDSPDGTGELADSLAASDSRVQVLHRENKAGLGAAYRAGFAWAIERGYSRMIQMDADGSHRPEDLARLLEADGEVVIGSRWCKGGQVKNWPLSRLVLSRGANLYTRLLLGLRVKDATAGFRVYTRSALERMDYDKLTSNGYIFQVEMTRRASQRGLRIVEVPITFVERELGASKMSSSIVREALLRVTIWGLQRVFRR